MNRYHAFLLAAAIVVGVSPYARSLGVPALPPGVQEDNWIPMGESAGFVVTKGREGVDPGAAKRTSNTMRGYFMVRHSGTWFRVDSSPEFETIPALNR
jgi:hypothetical protein